MDADIVAQVLCPKCGKVMATVAIEKGCQVVSCMDKRCELFARKFKRVMPVAELEEAA